MKAESTRSARGPIASQGGISPSETEIGRSIRNESATPSSFCRTRRKISGSNEAMSARERQPLQGGGKGGGGGGARPRGGGDSRLRRPRAADGEGRRARPLFFSADPAAKSPGRTRR